MNKKTGEQFGEGGRECRNLIHSCKIDSIREIRDQNLPGIRKTHLVCFWLEPCYLNRVPRLLIIDDDPDMAELLGHMADVLGHEHEYVPNSDRAFEAIERNPPDVIVLDVMLEDTDGWAVYRELTPVTQAPIIFITAFRTSENRRRASQMAADGFLAKPISHHDFASQITAALQQPARRLWA